MIKLPKEVLENALENARLARVLPCANCTMHVAHEAIATAITFPQIAGCPHMLFVCLACRKVLAPALIAAAAQAHADECSRRIIPATEGDLPKPADG